MRASTDCRPGSFASRSSFAAVETIATSNVARGNDNAVAIIGDDCGVAAYWQALLAGAFISRLNAAAVDTAATTVMPLPTRTRCSERAHEVKHLQLVSTHSRYDTRLLHTAAHMMQRQTRTRCSNGAHDAAANAHTMQRTRTRCSGSRQTWQATPSYSEAADTTTDCDTHQIRQQIVTHSRAHDAAAAH